jgi:Fe-S-cluster-containing dehydrogenase component
MSACPVEGAMYIDVKSHARVINDDICAGCRQCIEACGQNFDPPRIKFDENKNVAIKCDLCGMDPQCVRWCPNGAIKYINLSEFQKTGRRYHQDFQEPYTKDFGPDYEAFKGNEMTYEKLYPDKGRR